MNLPKYKSHKTVAAAKIIGLEDDDTVLVLEITGQAEPSRVIMSVDWLVRNKPVVGGYYVVYNDGYASFSPAKAFEEGYTALAQHVPAVGELTIPEAMIRAKDIIAVPDQLFDTNTARRLLTGLLAALQRSRCYWKAMLKGEEVFVLRQSDRAAIEPMLGWAHLAETHGCGQDKVQDALAMAHRWRSQDPSATKWPD